MAQCMGLDFGLNDDNIALKRKFRWLFTILGIVADAGSAKCLPPKRGARPSLGWKELECQHMTETIYYPWKPDWKPIQLIMYDVRCNYNPVFEWLRTTESGGGSGFYQPRSGTFRPIVPSQFKRDAKLTLLDGCGNIIEAWKLENCWPSSIEWGELDMDSSEVVMVETQIRYDRAYIDGDSPGSSSGGGGGGFGGGGGVGNSGGDLGISGF